MNEELRKRIEEIETGYGERADENAANIKRIEAAYNRFIRVAVIILALIAIVTGASGGISVYLLAQNGQRIEALSSANAALCALRNDMANRIMQAEKFLQEHPEGFAGVPAATLRQSVDQQRRTVAALTVLRCPDAASAGAGR